MAAGTTAYGAVLAPQPSTVQAVQNPVEDPTLGGLFELYTPEEYEESVNQIKKYMGADHEDVKAMEADLAKLKADNGKGEFVIYKGAFMFSLICWSSPFHIFVIAALFNDSASQ
ncbi:hypothetical protein VSQ48_12155 [Candidatus Ventrimonas sp. KK005]